MSQTSYVDVVDNGKGIAHDITGVGLGDLRQRAEAAGGTLTVGDRPGGGAWLRWVAPLS